MDQCETLPGVLLLLGILTKICISAPARRFSGPYGRGVVENNVSTDGQIAINRQIDVRELTVNAHTTVCGRSTITNRVRASVWAFHHALANVDVAVETLSSITPVYGMLADLLNTHTH